MFEVIPTKHAADELEQDASRNFLDLQLRSGAEAPAFADFLRENQLALARDACSLRRSWSAAPMP